MRKSILFREADLFELSQEILKKGKSIRFQAKGWSMRPFIRDGDFITVSPVANSSLKIGNVVLYLGTGNRVIVHRLIDKLKKERKVFFLIKGDATFSSADRVDAQNVFGKVMAIERNGRLKRLDTKLQQLIGLFVAGISPYSHWVYPLGGMVKRSGRKVLGSILEKLQSFSVYGTLVKKIIKGDILYQRVSLDVSYSFSEDERQIELEKLSDASRKKQEKSEDSDYRLVAKRKGRVIGGVTLTKFPRSDYPYAGWWLFGLGVNWRYRGLGIGEILVKMALEAAVKNKASEIKLLVFEDAKRARNLYQKLGFRRISLPELDGQLIQEAKKTLRRRIIMAKMLNKNE